MFNSKLLHHLATSLLCIVFFGCADEKTGPGLGSVKGLVTLEGKPLPNVTVTFTPVEKGSTSSGTTDQNGKYSLRYSASLFGAVPGEHKVTVVAAGPEDEANDGEFDEIEPEETDEDMEDFESNEEVDAARGQVRKKTASSVPDTYRKTTSTPLKATVVVGENDVPLPLTSK